MDFREYQKLSRKTAVYPDKGKNFIYPVLGLTGEAWEVAEKIKKVLGDNKEVFGETKKTRGEKRARRCFMVSFSDCNGA